MPFKLAKLVRIGNRCLITASLTRIHITKRYASHIRLYSTSFYDSENKHAYSIVSKYSLNSARNPVRVPHPACKEVLDMIEVVKKPAGEIDPGSHLSEMSNVDYLDLVSFIVRQKETDTSSASTLDRKTLARALDLESCKRLPHWTISQALQAAEVLYRLHYSRSSAFNSDLVGHFAGDVRTFTHTQFLKYMFHLNLSRKFHAKLNAHDLEQAFVKHFHAYDIEDLSVVVMAFFKCQKPIRNSKLVQSLVHKVILHSESVSDISLAALLKAIRLSVKFDNDLLVSIKRLQGVLLGQVPRLNFMNCLHLALVGSGMNLFNHTLLETVTQKFIQSADSVRVKELERLGFTLSFTQWDLPSSNKFWDVLERELLRPERQVEIDAYPGSLVSAVVYLIISNRFPEPLLKRVLDSSFIKSSKDMLRSLVIIDQSCQIERPHLDVPKLDPQLRNEILRQKALSLPSMWEKPTLTNSFLSDLHSSLDSITQNQTRQLQVLPYFDIPDFLLLMDSEGKVQPPPSDCVDFTTSPFHRICIVVGTRTMYLHNTPQPSGNLSLKIRQLRRLGYQVITVPWTEYQRLNSPTSKQSYLQGKLRNALQTIKRPPF